MVTTKRLTRNMHEKLQDGDELNVIADSVISQLDEFVVELGNMKSSVQIDSATGSDLDSIATLFGLSREDGENDATFRARIKAFFPGRVSSGTIAEIKETVSALTGIAESNITITEITSAKFRVTIILDGFDTDLDTIKSIVNETKAAGVYTFFSIQPIINEAVDVTESVSIISPINGIIVSEYGVGDSSVI